MQNCEQQAATLVDSSYVHQGLQGLASRSNRLRSLLAQRRIPEQPWDELSIEHALHELAMMDSNNFLDNVGAGEREGRVFSALVRRRHFGFSHGIGRSGDIAAVQPKAAGSSILNKLTNALTLHAMKLAGLEHFQQCVVLPLATGMALTTSFLTLRSMKPDATHVIWPRIDQQSCFKSILTAGLTPVVVEEMLVGDELMTDVAGIEAKIAELGADKVLCVMTTTSCFAPRGCDAIDEVARLCARHDVYHVINNAYGLQSADISKLLNRAHAVGRVDIVVQSTDKNFMVPVGGAIVASKSKALVKEVSKIYPGRASIAPIQDLFITLLSMGANGYKALLAQREELRHTFAENLRSLAARFGERVLETPHNSISIGISLQSLSAGFSKDPTFLGSMLFHRCVSGARVVAPGTTKKIGPHSFSNWGSNSDNYPVPYMTIACAIGLTPAESEEILARLDSALSEFVRKYATSQRESDATS